MNGGGPSRTPVPTFEGNPTAKPQIEMSGQKRQHLGAGGLYLSRGGVEIGEPEGDSAGDGAGGGGVLLSQEIEF